MTVAWQRNLATTTATLEIYNILLYNKEGKFNTKHTYKYKAKKTTTKRLKKQGVGGDVAAKS